MIVLAGGTPVAVTLPAADNFRITADRLREKITPRTKALMVNSPNNPTGRVITREELDAVVEVALEHDLYVISDEIYESIIFDGRQHLSPAAQPGMAERTPCLLYTSSDALGSSSARNWSIISATGARSATRCSPRCV